MARALFILAAALALVGGCATTPATRYYALTTTVDAVASRPGPAPTVIVREVQLPQYLERPQIVSRGSANRLLVAEHEQWGGDLRQDMTRILAENLGRLLASERVVAAPHSLRLTPDYRVDLEVLRFERASDGRVALAARWWLTRGSDATLLASPGLSLFGAPLAADAPYDAIVAAMSAVYGDLARAIAASIDAAGVTQ